MEASEDAIQLHRCMSLFEAKWFGSPCLHSATKAEGMPVGRSLDREIHHLIPRDPLSFYGSLHNQSIVPGPCRQLQPPDGAARRREGERWSGRRRSSPFSFQSSSSSPSLFQSALFVPFYQPVLDLRRRAAYLYAPALSWADQPVHILVVPSYLLGPLRCSTYPPPPSARPVQYSGVITPSQALSNCSDRLPSRLFH